MAQPKDAYEEIASCAIVTTSANGDVRFVHDRMPVVLDGPAAEAAWLDPSVDLDAAVQLVRPLPDACSTSRPCRRRSTQAGPKALSC